MKIGIMSMQRIVNYGSFLQAYGLKKTIERLGHEVQFVDYKIEKAVSENTEKRRIYISDRVKKIIKMLSPRYRRWRKKQIKMNITSNEFISKYNNEFLPIINVNKKLNLLPEVDTLVIGSDEVFNCTQSGSEVGYSKQLFGQDRNAQKLISYAASFGNTTLKKLQDLEIDLEIKEFLLEFNAISVRDENSYNIVSELTNKRPYKNIDPVLLYEFPEIDEIKINIKNYIIVYAYAGRITEAEERKIKEFAKKRNKKIISLGFYQPFCDEWIDASPFEVLAYVRDADYVITDTFHGTVFSIKYHKKFGTIIRESNKQKLKDLLNMFNLNDHQIIELNSLEEIMEKDINTEKLYEILEKQKENSIEYLKKYL